MGRPPQIIAFGGGGFSMENENPLLDDHVLPLAGRERSRVCFVPTASGDADHYVVRFYRTFSAVADTSHVSLLRRDRGAGAVEGCLRDHLLAQDVIYVGGGSVVSMLGAWVANGLDRIRNHVRAGMVAGFGVDDGCALHFVGTELHDVVTSKPGAGAYRVEARAGEPVETPLDVRDLGAAIAPAVAA